MARKPIVVVGSSNTDMIIKLDRIPRPGETILGGEFVTAAGGKGANQAVAAARAGGRVSFIARVGRDVFGDQAVAGFVKDRIDVRTRRARQGGPVRRRPHLRGQETVRTASPSHRGPTAASAPADVEKARELDRLGCRRRDAARNAARHGSSRRRDRG